MNQGIETSAEMEEFTLSLRHIDSIKEVGNMRPLWVICDTSGSMSEGGKQMLVRNLLSYVVQAVRLLPSFSATPSLRIISWGNATKVVDWDTIAEIRPFHCTGKTVADVLTALLSKEWEAVALPRLLILSDGNWHRDEIAHLARWRRSITNLSLRIIATGSDANLQTLRQLAGPTEVFTPEEIVGALDSWNCSKSLKTNDEFPENSMSRGGEVS